MHGVALSFVLGIRAITTMSGWGYDWYDRYQRIAFDVSRGKQKYLLHFVLFILLSKVIGNRVSPEVLRQQSDEMLQIWAAARAKVWPLCTAPLLYTSRCAQEITEPTASDRLTCEVSAEQRCV